MVTHSLEILTVPQRIVLNAMLKSDPRIVDWFAIQTDGVGCCMLRVVGTVSAPDLVAEAIRRAKDF